MIKKILLVTTILSLTQWVNGQNVGIGTTTPVALLHVEGVGTGGGNVLFVGSVKGSPGNPPASGAGTRMMWYPDKAAFRAGEALGSEWDINQIGEHSMAVGLQVKASGARSFAMGLNSMAEGLNSIAMGFEASATGAYARSIGNFTSASGNISTAMGSSTLAPSFSEFVIGRLNTVYTPLNATGWNNSDRLFVVGNGTDINNRSDAFVIMKNGAIGAGISLPAAFSDLHLHNKNANQVYQRFTNTATGTTFSDGLRIGIRENTHLAQLWNFENGGIEFGTNNNQSMIISNNGFVGIGTPSPTARLTVVGSGDGGGNVAFLGEYTGTLNSMPTTGIGVRLMWLPNKGAFRAGAVTSDEWDALNIGNFSTAMGINALASGEGSVAIGQNVAATGQYSAALGRALASGNYAFAAGDKASATGLASSALGDGNAPGDHSFAVGNATNATSLSSTAFGRFNRVSGNPTSWVATDPLFEIGNGTAANARNNAFTVLKNGKTGINTHAPDAQLTVDAPANENGLRVRIGGTTRLTLTSTGGLAIGGNLVPPDAGLVVSGESKLQQNVNIGNGFNPNATLHIRHINATAGLMPDQGIRIQNLSGTNRFWTLYTFSSNGNLALYSSTGDGVSVGNFNAGTGAYTATSNRYLKTNVELLDADILGRIQQLQPATYSYIRDPLQQRTVGFMAEDVQPIFPELVDTIGENGENLAINYAGFSVVAIRAIQLLEEKHEALQKELSVKEKRITSLENDLQEIKQLLKKVKVNE
jgi:hypothetical protein